MTCRYMIGIYCDNIDCEHYTGECIHKMDEDCSDYEKAWEYPDHCPTCQFNYGSDKCHGCEPVEPTNYRARPRQTDLKDNNAKERAKKEGD